MSESSVLTNRNLLSQQNWRFNLKRAPSINYNIQETNIPDIAFPNVPMVPTPFIKYPVTGDQMVFKDLTVSFKVDEDLQNWFEIFSWITALGSPENFEGYKQLSSQPAYSSNGVYSDLTMLIQNAEHETKYIIEYKDTFPIFLGNFKLTTTLPNVNYVTAGAVFKYTTYDIQPYLPNSY